MPIRIRLRRGTAAQWTASNTVLALGEVGVEIGDPPRVKVGDGVNGWNALPYTLGAQGIQGVTGAQGPTGDKGDPGADGADGINGANGANGKSVLSGTTAPSGGTGVDGDFYIDTEAMLLFGPKTSGSWGIGNALSATSRTPAPPLNAAPPSTPNPGSDGAAWPSLWTTFEDSTSGIQDWNSNQLRLVSPSNANEASKATATFAAQVQYRFSLSFPVIADMTSTFSFRGSSNMSNRFDLIFSPDLDQIELKRVDSGTPVSLSLTSAYTFVANQPVAVKVTAFNGQINVKIWQGGTVEPSANIFEYTTTLYKTNTYARFECKSGATATARTLYIPTFSVETGILSLDPTEHTALSASQNFSTGTTALDVNFINQTGSLVVASQMLGSAATSLGEAYYNYDITSNDHYVQAKLIIGTSGTNVTAGVTARHSTSTNTFYKFSTAAGLTNVKLYKVIAGVATELGTYAANFSTSTTRTLRLEVQGNSVRCYIDGTQVIAVIDSSITTGTYAGASIDPGASTSNARLDDFVVAALTATPSASTNILVTQDFTSGAVSADINFTDMLPGPSGAERAVVVSSGHAQVADTVAYRHAYAMSNVDMVSADHWVEGDIVVGSTINDQYIGVLARVSTPATGPSYSFYKWETSASTSQVRCISVVNNVVTNTWNRPYQIDANQTYKLRLEVIGSNIRGFINGEKILDINDTSLTTQTKVGFNVGRTDNTLATAWIDNFRAGNFLTGGSSGGGGTGGSTGITFTETFNTGSVSADAHLTNLRGTMAILGGYLQAGSTSTEIDAYHTTDLGSANHYAEADFVIGAADTTTYCALNVRMATSGLNYYSIETNANRSKLELLRVQGGTYTSLGLYTTGWALNSTHKVKLEVNGSTLKVYTDGVLRLTATDTSITTGTKIGVHMWTTNVSNIKIDNLVGGVIGSATGTTTFTALSSGVGTGTFTTVGRHIVDPAGYKFIPLGMNGYSAPTGVVPSSGWWATNMRYVNGRATTYKNDWKSNFLRINVKYDSASVYSENDFLTGVWAAADEYLAEQIVVCCSDHHWTADAPYNPPTYNDLMADSFFTSLFEGWIARYKDNKYAWLYPLNEPWRSNNLAGWAATGTALYNRARELGWTGIFVWDMPNWARGINYASESTRFEDFLNGKVNTVLSWHNYGNGSSAQRSTWAQACNTKNIPVIIGECGQSPWDNPTANTADALQWTYDNCWTYGFGMVQWNGAMNTANDSTVRMATGAAFYETEYAVTNQGQKLIDLGTNQPLPQAITAA